MASFSSAQPRPPVFARRLICSVLLLQISIACFAGAPASRPAPIELAGIDGKTYQPLNVAEHRAAVLVFVLQDCPICNGYAPQIRRLAEQFTPKGTQFYLVHVDATLTAEAARKHASDFGYTIPVLIDSKHELVGSLDVVAVPTAVVLGADGAVKYHGRIDDRYTAIGKTRSVTTKRDLQDAIAATLNETPIAEPHTKPIGCAVPDLPGGK